MVATQQLLLTGAGTPAVTDPLYSSVVFLWEAEGTNNQTAGLVEARNNRAITCSGTGKLSTTQARLGLTSLFVGTGGASLANNADWQLGNTSNTSPWCIEFSTFQGTLQTYEAIQFWDGSQKSWWLRLQTDGNVRLLASSTGTSSFSMDVTTTGFGITTGAWHDCCIEKDATGLIRFMRNGLVKFTNTPADSKFFASTNSHLIFNTQSTSDAYIDHIRFTKAARYNGAYTFVASPFPTS
jgi:hypothetical protein